MGRGWVGTKMYLELLGRGYSPIHCSHTDVLNYVNSYSFDWIVNCAGVTGTPNVDACEVDKASTLKGNALFPIELYELAKTFKARFAHWSSGCIYEGVISDTHAAPNFFGSIYSISKGISDSYLLDKAVVFRIRMPFTGTDEPKNYLTKVYKYALHGKLIDGGPNSLTDLDEAVSVACDLLESGAADGPYNLVNSGTITMHELAEMMNLSPRWFTPEEFISVTTALRSNCTIPSYTKMKPVKLALADALTHLFTSKEARA